MLILQRPWTTQPQTPTRLRAPVLREFAINGAQPAFDAAIGRHVPLTNAGGAACSITAGQYGRALKTPNGSWSDHAVGTDWSGACTVDMFVRINSVDTAWGGLFAKRSSGASAQVVVGRSNTTTEVYFGVNDATTRNFSSLNINDLTSAGWLAISITFDGANLASWYQNGLFVGSTSSTLGTQNTGTGTLLLGAERSGNAGFDSDVEWLFFRFRPGVASGESISRLHKNFWQIFQPRRIYIPTAAAAGGVPTLSASTYVTGSLTSTGWRPQITAS